MIRRVVSVWLLLGAGIALAAGNGAAGESDGYRMLLFLHQVLFVFWLGPDIGIYMWGTKAGNPELSVAQRVAAARIMRVIDVLPKVCMSLMLTIGGVLTELKGIPHPWWQMVGIVLLGPVWLTLTLLTYARAGSEASAKFVRMDELFRWAVIATVVLSVVYSTLTDRLTDFPWVTAKLLIFAAVVLFGILVRRRLAPFNDAIERIDGDQVSDEVNTTLRRSLSASRPFVIATWVALAMAAWLGMAQPGGEEVTAVASAQSQSQ
jgi:hypothetical protein